MAVTFVFPILSECHTLVPVVCKKLMYLSTYETLTAAQSLFAISTTSVMIFPVIYAMVFMLAHILILSSSQSHTTA